MERAIATGGFHVANEAYYTSVRPRPRLIGLSLCVMSCLAAGGAAGGEPRIGFANAARDGAAGRAAIDAIRQGVVAKSGYRDLGEGPARETLEEPISSDGGAGAVLARAAERMAAAKEAYASFELNGALDALHQAESLLGGVRPSAETVALLAELNLLRGLVRIAGQEADRAVEAFALVYRLTPERRGLDPGVHRPQVVTLYGRAVDAVEQAPRGRLRVVTEPPGTVVWIDGRPAGEAPLEVELGAGEHYVVATLPGHAPRTERVPIAAGETSSLELLVPRLPAEARARSVRAQVASGELEPERAARTLADLASVDALVLVRQRDDGSLEAAVWDARSGRLSAFGPATVERVVAALPPPPRRVPLSLTVGEQGSGRGLPPGDSPTRDEERPGWYGTWWGTAAIVGVTVVTVGLVWALSSSDEPVSYSVGGGGFTIE